MNFKLSDKDRKILFIFLSIAVIAIAYFFIYSPNMSDVDNINEEIKTLKGQLQVLQSMEAETTALQAEIKDYNAKIDKIVQSYPCYVSEEKMIESVLQLESVSQMHITTIGFQLFNQFYPEAVAVAGNVIDANSTNSTNTSTTETTTIAQPTGMKNSMNLSFDVTYDGLKRAIDFFNQNPDCISINSLTVQFDSSTGGLSGTMAVDYYYIVEAGTPYQEPKFITYGTGVDDIFGTFGE